MSVTQVIFINTRPGFAKIKLRFQNTPPGFAKKNRFFTISTDNNDLLRAFRPRGAEIHT